MGTGYIEHRWCLVRSCRLSYHLQAWRRQRQIDRERRDAEFTAMRAERDAERKQRAKELAGDPFDKEVCSIASDLRSIVFPEPVTSYGFCTLQTHWLAL